MSFLLEECVGQVSFYNCRAIVGMSFGQVLQYQLLKKERVSVDCIIVLGMSFEIIILIPYHSSNETRR